MSVAPEATVVEAKLSVDVDPLTAPALTVMDGLPVRVTPLMLTVKLLADPAVVPVKVAV
jgi:hypothetical protein